MNELDLLLLLLLAHVLGDFFLQPLSWVKDRLQWHFKSPKLQLHVSVHMGLSLAVLLAWQWRYGWSHDSLMAVALALAIGLSHYLIDVAKSYSSNGLMAFLLDQLAHLGVLLLLWSAYTANWQWWPPMLPQNSLILLLAYLLVLTPSSVLIGQLLRRWRPDLLSVPAQGLPAGGQYIGMLERVLILTFVLLDQFAVIGFILVGKALFRFADLSRAQDTKLTEYVLLGTFFSMVLSLLIGLSLRLVL
ncbi:DUF3307 domain-containing protein [Rheinheimera sp. F8]|uniref:DUF3307 domain-containing protein n=1 Tax=Rheinheimera sp. F8 TaxID=1763998 RepID=UPI000744B13B|nr:DUF3307 domain-containing protein [Rheinheimera sp. F8]ALZ74367.1 hypothetical protein ATY27_00335 [Rheinheimera sp. F8]